MRRISYTAAGNVPWKLLLDSKIVNEIKRGFIPPVHLQINPTNICNLTCPFCSCANRNRQEQIDIERLMKFIYTCAQMGAKAITITGGGEPLLYPDINKLIRGSVLLGIKVGLVTNGTQFEKLFDTAINRLTWIRISVGDHRKMDWESIYKTVCSGEQVDWAFSYVLSNEPNYHLIRRTIQFANQWGFTHVRLVTDIMDTERVSAKMDGVKKYLKDKAVDISKVIFQDRSVRTRGIKDCRVSLLKPVVGADGGIYPCCGVQYAQDPPGYDYVPSMRMGWIEDVERIWQEQDWFDGRECVKCYYEDYNQALRIMGDLIDHEEFV